MLTCESNLFEVTERQRRRESSSLFTRVSSARTWSNAEIGARNMMAFTASIHRETISPTFPRREKARRFTILEIWRPSLPLVPRPAHIIYLPIHPLTRPRTQRKRMLHNAHRLQPRLQHVLIRRNILLRRDPLNLIQIKPRALFQSDPPLAQSGSHPGIGPDLEHGCAEGGEDVHGVGRVFPPAYDFGGSGRCGFEFGAREGERFFPVGRGLPIFVHEVVHLLCNLVGGMLVLIDVPVSCMWIFAGTLCRTHLFVPSSGTCTVSRDMFSCRRCRTRSSDILITSGHYLPPERCRTGISQNMLPCQQSGTCERLLSVDLGAPDRTGVNCSGEDHISILIGFELERL